MSTFLAARWQNLILANFAADPAALQPLVPAGTELDPWQGIHYVSVVGFRFLDTRVWGLRLPGHVNFTEVNLRFYVRQRVGDAWRRGVVFLKEIVAKPMISFVANTVYGEPYATHPMRYSWQPTAERLSVEYAWRMRGCWDCLRAEADPAPLPMAAGSEAEFITEHYWGFTRLRSGRTGIYEVQHPRWRVHAVRRFECSVEGLRRAMPRLAGALVERPLSVFLAEGSAVKVLAGGIV